MRAASGTTDGAPSPALHDAYAHCMALARSHYENFPVASLLIPRNRRPAIAAVYAFARTADDMADEGSMPPEERLRRLDDWQQQLDRAVNGEADHPVFIALADTLARYAIPPSLCSDLLTAFRWDVTRNRYETFSDLLGYCRCSANPVGRIVLHVFGDASVQKLEWSDAVCTALQLTNFWQDVSVDLRKDRIYLPLEDFERFQYFEGDLRNGVTDDRFRKLLQFQVNRTRDLFRSGRPLINEAVPSLRLELALTWNGGTRILRMIERSGYDVLNRRPVLRWTDKLSVLLQSLIRRRAQ